MQYPETLTTIIKEAAAASPSDIDKAEDFAFRQWKKCREFAEWTEALIRGQIRNMIHDARHTTNIQIRRDLKEFGGPPKVGLGSGRVNRIAAMSVLDTYHIDGRAIGDVFGKELRDIANGEREKSAGYARNARLCLLLAEIVPAEKTVRQSVSETKAQELIKRSETNKSPKSAKVKAA